MRFLMDLSRKNGITTTSELAFGTVSLALEEVVFDKYFNDPASPMRCVVVTDGATLAATKGDQAVAFAKSLPSRNTDKLIFNGVKFFAGVHSFLSLGMEWTSPDIPTGVRASSLRRRTEWSKHTAHGGKPVSISTFTATALAAITRQSTLSKV